MSSIKLAIKTGKLNESTRLRRRQTLYEKENQDVQHWLDQVVASGSSNKIKTYIDVSDQTFVSVNPGAPNYGLKLVGSVPSIVDASDKWISPEDLLALAENLDREEARQQAIEKFPFKTPGEAGKASGRAPQGLLHRTTLPEGEVNEAPPGGQKKRVKYDDPIRRAERERRRQARRAQRKAAKAKLRGSWGARASKPVPFGERKLNRELAGMLARAAREHEKAVRAAAMGKRISNIKNVIVAVVKDNAKIALGITKLDAFGQPVDADAFFNKIDKKVNQLELKWGQKVDKRVLRGDVHPRAGKPGGPAKGTKVGDIHPGVKDKPDVRAVKKKAPHKPVDMDIIAKNKDIKNIDKMKADLDIEFDKLEPDLSTSQKKQYDRMHKQLDKVRKMVLRKAKPSRILKVLKGTWGGAKWLFKKIPFIGTSAMAFTVAFTHDEALSFGATKAHAAELTAYTEADPTGYGGPGIKGADELMSELELKFYTPGSAERRRGLAHRAAKCRERARGTYEGPTVSYPEGRCVNVDPDRYGEERERGYFMKSNHRTWEESKKRNVSSIKIKVLGENKKRAGVNKKRPSKIALTVLKENKK